MIQFWADCVIKSTLVLVLAFTLSSLLKGRRASSRHLVWLFAFLCVLLMPIGQAIAPEQALLPPVKAAQVAPIAFMTQSESLVPQQLPSSPSIVQTSLPPLVAGHSGGGPAPQRTDWHSSSLPGPASPQSLDLANIFAAVWVGGALLVGAYRFVGAALALLLQRSAAPYFGNIETALRAAEVRTPVTVLVNGRSSPSVPMTWGIRRPIVMLPNRVDQWPERQVESVVLHELGHVRRKDMLSLALASVACAIYWFNPVVWLAARAMRMEAETAADDFALAAGMAPSEYADDLLHVAAFAGRRTLLPAAGISAMRSPKIERRVQAILDPGRPRRGATGLELLAVASVLVGLAGGTASLRLRAQQIEAQQVAFKSHKQGADVSAKRLPFIQEQIASGKGRMADYDGPAIVYSGNVVDVLKTSTRNQRAAAAPPAAQTYWLLQLPYEGGHADYLNLYLVRRQSSASEWESFSGNGLVEGQTRPATPDHVLWDLNLQSTPRAASEGQQIGSGNSMFRPGWVADEAYRKRLAANGFSIVGLSDADGSDLWNMRQSRVLEATLWSATERVLAQRSEPQEELKRAMKANLASTALQSTVEADGKTVHFNSEIPARPPERFVTKPQAERALLDASRRLDSLPQDLARAAIRLQEAKASGEKPAIYDAQDRFDRLQAEQGDASNALSQAALAYRNAFGDNAFEALRARTAADAKAMQAAMFSSMKAPGAPQSKLDAQIAQQRIMAAQLKASVFGLAVMQRQSDLSMQQFIGGWGAGTVVDSFEARDEPIDRVLTRLHRQFHLDYRLDRTVSGDITIRATNLPIEVLVRYVARELNAIAVQEENGFDIHPYSSQKGLVTVDVQSGDVRQILEDMAFLCDRKIDVPNDELGSITIRLHDVPMEQALEQVCEKAQLHSSKVGAKFLVTKI